MRVLVFILFRAFCEFEGTTKIKIWPLRPTWWAANKESLNHHGFVLPQDHGPHERLQGNQENEQIEARWPHWASSLRHLTEAPPHWGTSLSPPSTGGTHSGQCAVWHLLEVPAAATQGLQEQTSSARRGWGCHPAKGQQGGWAGWQVAVRRTTGPTAFPPPAQNKPLCESSPSPRLSST